MTKGIFANNLKFYRKKQGLTQAALGKKSGVGQVNITNYERGTRFPGEETLIILAENLGIPLNLLFNINDKKLESSSIMTFTLEQLIKMLLNDSLKDCLTYIHGWKITYNFTLENTFTKIIIPLLKETGLQWQKGEISISEEHLISAKIREIISLLSSAVYKGEIRDAIETNDNNVWMGFCAPSDKHDLALFMLSQLVKNRGWKTYFIGSEVPINDVLSTIRKYKPTVVCISISMDLFRGGLDAYLQKLNDAEDVQCPVIICGNGADKTYVSEYQIVNYYASTFTKGYEEVLKLEKRK